MGDRVEITILIVVAGAIVLGGLYLLGMLIGGIGAAGDRLKAGTEVRRQEALRLQLENEERLRRLEKERDETPPDE
jgi:hypothetical protein